MTNEVVSHDSGATSQDSGSLTVQEVWVSSSSFQGPLPPAEELSKYQEVSPDFPKRLLEMVEAEACHRRQIEEKVVDAEIASEKENQEDRKRGQYLGFLIAIVTIVAGSYLSLNGSQLPGTFIGLSGVTGLTAAFIHGRKRQEQESNEKGEAEN